MQFGLHSILIILCLKMSGQRIAAIRKNAEGVQQEYVKPRRLFAMNGAAYSTYDAGNNKNPRQTIENLFNFCHNYASAIKLSRVAGPTEPSTASPRDF